MYKGKICIKERKRVRERDIFSQPSGDCFLLRVDYEVDLKEDSEGRISCPSRVETLFGHAVVAEHRVAGSRVALLKGALCVQNNSRYKGQYSREKVPPH